MKIKSDVREKAGLFTPATHIIRITEVTRNDAVELFDTICLMHVDYERKAQFELYVRGEGIDASDFFDTLASTSHFLFGYELAMQMNGINVKASW